LEEEWAQRLGEVLVLE
jgi:hypothetical protein